MSDSVIKDNVEFQTKFGFNKEPFDKKKLAFRMELLVEEFNETMKAYKDKDPEEWVDGHIDIIVIALGNLYLAGVDVSKAWNTVFTSNMSKTRGTKPGRESSGGFDVIKEPGKFIPVSHKGNHGVLKDIMR